MKLHINSCGVSDCPPSWHWITRKKGFLDYDLWVVFRGKGWLGPVSTPEVRYQVREGSALLLEPNEQIEAKHDPSFPLFVIHAHFDFLDDDGNIIHPYKITAKSFPDVTFMRTMLMRMVTMFNSNKTEEATAFLSAALAEFMTAEPLGGEPTEDAWLRIISEICTDVESRTKIPTLGECSARYGYTYRYIGKKFKQILGISYSEYVKNARIGKAKMLLCHTDIPIAKLSEQIGFYDTGHFTNAFKAVVGQTPSEYRKHPEKGSS